MRIVDRYIAISFLSSFVILMLVGIGLYILSDLLLNIDEFTRDNNLPLGQVLTLMVDFYGSNVPLYCDQLAGPMMALAAAFTFAVMLRNNEFTALVAAGMHLGRLTLPVIFCCLFLIVGTVINREMVIPSYAEKIGRSRQDIFTDQSTSVPVARDPSGVVVTAARSFRNSSRLEGVYFLEADSEGQPAALVQADAAEFDPTTGLWRLERGIRYSLGHALNESEFTIETTPIHEFPLGLTPGEVTLRRNAQWADYLSLVELRKLLASDNLPNRGSISMAAHVRFTQPMIQLVLVLLVIPYFLTRERANVLVSGGWSLLIGGTFFATVFVSQHLLAGSGYHDAVAWGPLIVFGPFAVTSLTTIRT